MHAVRPGLLALVLWALIAPWARAESTRSSDLGLDRYELSVQSETYAQLFRRALLPGPNGSLVSTDTVAPLHEYVSLRATDLDTAWRKDSLDFELAAWGRAWFGPRNAERPFEGDVQTANVHYRHGPVSLRLGRQVVAGGAARFARFDGLGVEAELGAGITARAYGGFTALPRWNQRPYYDHLGAASDSLLRDSEALEAAPRHKYWLAGARLGWASAERRAGLSFHEQRERSGLSQRSLGALSCADTWCHGPNPNEHADSPSWVSSEALTCTSCHGAPPPAPHPQMSDCSRCHAAVVSSDNVTIVDRARHVDGVVDVDVDPSCTSCHGAENPAPPRDTAGREATTFSGVGAHQAHLGPLANARSVACSECHAVPTGPLDPGHIDSPLPAEVAFAGAATAFGAMPVYEQGTCRETACHGGVFPDNHRSGGSNVTPTWTTVDGSQARCGGCHGLPPPRPHPYPTNCSQCHENVASDNISFVHPELHVDGIVTFTVP